MLSDAMTALVDMTVTTAVLRLVAAACLGGLVGFEREWRDRPAGLRTHTLIAIAAALFAILSIEIAGSTAIDQDRLRIDPLRVLEAITSGVAFLAAGSIIVTKGTVRGITTGAGMWLAGAIGACCGLGFFQLAAIATALGLVVLILLRLVDHVVGGD